MSNPTSGNKRSPVVLIIVLTAVLLVATGLVASTSPVGRQGKLVEWMCGVIILFIYLDIFIFSIRLPANQINTATSRDAPP